MGKSGVNAAKLNAVGAGHRSIVNISFTFDISPLPFS